ncbi:hypothetical protein SNEBB_009689 [Seison nebaliae]|nr:hypothetical protein SNEBB_009689 [Seison nebaliae]
MRSVFGVGSNFGGQLGECGEDVSEFKKVKMIRSLRMLSERFGTKPTQICAGGMHSIMLDNKGNIFTIGANDDNALGRTTEDENCDNDLHKKIFDDKFLDNNMPEFIPAKVSIPEKACQICTGDSHSMALCENGEIFVWGTFRDGHSTLNVSSNSPVKVTVSPLGKGEKIIDIQSGDQHHLCLSNIGNVFSSGDGTNGQLGRISKYCADRGGRRGIEEFLNLFKVRFPRGIKKIDRIWCGKNSSFFLCSDKAENRKMYVCGINVNKMLMDDEKIQNIYFPTIHQQITNFLMKHDKNSIIDITMTLTTIHILLNDGFVYVVGEKKDCCLGISMPNTKLSIKEFKGIPLKNIQLISASDNVMFAVNKKHEIYSWGLGTNAHHGHGNNDIQIPKLLKIPNTKNVHAISTNTQHTLFLLNSNELC